MIIIMPDEVLAYPTYLLCPFPGLNICMPLESLFKAKCLMMVTLLIISIFKLFNSSILYNHLQRKKENFGDIWKEMLHI